MRLSIDWGKVINDDEVPSAELVVTSAMDGEEHKEGLSNLSNTELTEKIRRLKRSLSGTIGARLRDGGEKLRANIKLHEGELERRQRVSSQKGEAVVLVDEEEPDANKAAERMDEVVECRNATKVYYPSRDDPESVEICCLDMESLAPEAYLSSTIMNFYIRYLQKTKAHADVDEYHFFNTYFYKKLKEAVLSKQNEKEASFFKLRRWWKGVNIFEKAYIFLPIHEDLHWSLVIICIPDKDDKLGPILLHLDSLGLHCSKSLFGTIRKFLEQEWKFLRQGEVPTLPFSDKIWENLPRRIDENVIPVPQQRNEYDCGLFVLFFMERFMEEVHGRLKKKNFVMFGRRWFKPEEASRLRMKIHNILEEEFKNACED